MTKTKTPPLTPELARVRLEDAHARVTRAEGELESAQAERDAIITKCARNGILTYAEMAEICGERTVPWVQHILRRTGLLAPRPKK